ncbi:branched-chain amino acid ABC transporter permease [Candidatus Bathyarchaeota archaeon]|nr:MAG: branched-chain amino acid ABC transporter permease [Candidatus Bathyarchaeota archaeon]
MMPPIVFLVLSIMAEAGIFIIITLSLNLEVGLTGLPQFGRVLAVEAGAFAVGGVAARILAYALGFPAGINYAKYLYNYRIVDAIEKVLAKNVPLAIGYFLLSLFIAAVFGAGIGWLTSRPAIRLREAYLGISLLAWGDVLMWIAYNWWPLVGGSTAVGVPDPLAVIGETYGGFYRFMFMTFLIFGIAILVYLYLERLTKSPFGRTLKMHRDCELAASVYGIDLVKLRTKSLMIGSAIAAIGGALYVMYSAVCNAGTFTRLLWTFWPWAYMMLGGIGSNSGVFVGVLVFIVVRALIVLYRFDIARIFHLPFDPIWLEYTFVGLALVLIVLFKPYGLIPEKPTSALSNERIQEIIARVKGEAKKGS